MYHHTWFYIVLGMECNTLCILDKHCTNYIPSPEAWVLDVTVQTFTEQLSNFLK